MAKIVLRSLSSEQLVKLHVLHLLVSCLIWQVHCVPLILFLNALLPCHTRSHPLHVAVVILHEGSHRRVKALNSLVLVF